MKKTKKNKKVINPHTPASRHRIKVHIFNVSCTGLGLTPDRHCDPLEVGGHQNVGYSNMPNSKQMPKPVNSQSRNSTVDLVIIMS